MEYLKVFVGYKYQSTQSNLRSTFILTEDSSGNDQVADGTWDLEEPAHGPALGIGISTTISNNFFATANISALYMRSVFHFNEIILQYYRPTALNILTPDPPWVIRDISFKAHQFGLNVEPAIGMSVEPIVVTLGIRFQWMRHKFLEDVDVGVPVPSWDWSNDYLYGIFVSVLYML